MTEPLHPDHLRLLALANAAFRARDNRELWTRSIREGAEEIVAVVQDALSDALDALADGPRLEVEE
jgi:hypothetical protein